MVNYIIFHLIRERPYLCHPHFINKFIKIQVTLCFHKHAPVFGGPEFWKKVLELYLLMIRFKCVILCACFIILLAQDRIIIILTVKFEINNLAFALEDSFEGQSNWNTKSNTPSGYAINICTFHRLCLYDNVSFWRTLAHTIKLNFSILRHLCWQDIAFQIWCFPCNSQWSKLP